MGVYKLSSAGGLATPRTNYSSFLAGNPKFVPPSYESIASNTVGSGGASTITFSSIPSTYTHLQARIMTTASTLDDLGMKVNSNVGLKTHWLRGNGTTAVALVNNPWSTYGLYISENGNETTYPNAIIVDLLDYTNTNKNKVIRILGGIDKNGSGRVWFASGLFDDLTAVSSITFTSSFAQYTSIALYGIKGA
jgi:hypothetical protein